MRGLRHKSRHKICQPSQAAIFRVAQAYTSALKKSRPLPNPQDRARAKARITMTWKSKLALGILTAVAMFVLTFALPRGGTIRDAAVVQFPVTEGVWAIFVLLFVKLK